MRRRTGDWSMKPLQYCSTFHDLLCSAGINYGQTESGTSSEGYRSWEVRGVNTILLLTKQY